MAAGVDECVDLVSGPAHLASVPTNTRAGVGWQQQQQQLASGVLNLPCSTNANAMPMPDTALRACRPAFGPQGGRACGEVEGLVAAYSAVEV